MKISPIFKINNNIQREYRPHINNNNNLFLYVNNDNQIKIQLNSSHDIYIDNFKINTSIYNFKINQIYKLGIKLQELQFNTSFKFTNDLTQKVTLPINEDKEKYRQIARLNDKISEVTNSFLPIFNLNTMKELKDKGFFPNDFDIHMYLKNPTEYIIYSYQKLIGKDIHVNDLESDEYYSLVIDLLKKHQDNKDTDNSTVSSILFLTLHLMIINYNSKYTTDIITNNNNNNIIHDLIYSLPNSNQRINTGNTVNTVYYILQLIYINIINKNSIFSLLNTSNNGIKVNLQQVVNDLLNQLLK